MKSRKILGILLIVLGCVSLGYRGITYTRREKVLELGSLVATADRQETIPLSPWVGGIAIAAGIAVLTVKRHA
jgi:hypothetical protein